MRKKIIFWTLIILLPFTAVLISGEVAFRFYYHVRYSATQNSIQSIILDDRLGWRTAPNYRYYGYKQDDAGNRHEIDIQTNQEGFRIFGKIDSSRKKILFLGDSYTHAQQVSNAKTYYGILQEQQIGEIFAYGTSGYGTLQEFMILDQFIDVIHPDIIVLQYCSNDFVNNSYELELRSSWNNSGKRRPYMTVEGEIIYAIPKNHLVQVRDFISRHSRFLNSVFWRIDKLYAATHKKKTIELVIQQADSELPLFQAAVHITEQLLQKIRTRVPRHIPIYGFSVDDMSPFFEKFQELSMRNNIYFIDSIPDLLKNSEQKGIAIKAADNIHWNETGHAIVAEELRQYLEASDVVHVLR